ncbi:hypothetical protein [Chryseobacterium indoltheticum]|uniref:DUF4878 domain-containing protein n=1 Tax=Chryseobacterium indoltheticum TaxID=254 RepID=A0A381FGF0_9FLAO|nr:hypothetical protein [Chryseobacterium indoltheticum]AZA74573.1 hypothetical protein EG358_12735 [Chryseobacterium indoltheticum]SIQ09328.1 hypothetical protein SAMN05421682_102323 [Chryseobacterium indoltheticum]SUX45597.1 Uncharacterised protein [Chryseobacterium indoltheticum]
MKTKLITSLFILISTFSFTQTKVNTDDQAIRKSMVYFANTIKYKKLDQTVDAIYPKFFTIVNKDQFTQMLNMTYNNPFVKIDVLDMKFISVGKPELVEGENFSITSYYLKLKADVSSMNEQMKKSVSEMLEKKYGKGSVEYLAKEDAYIINAPMKMVAVSKDKKDWKVVFADKEYKKQLTKVLPQKILDKL